MSSRLIIRTKRGVEIHSSIKVDDIVIIEKNGNSINQSPEDFCANNPVYVSLTNRELEKLIRETEKKLRWKRNVLNLTND